VTTDSGGLFDGETVLGGDLAALLLQPVPDVTLLDGVAQRACQGGLAADDFDGAFKCVHGPNSTKRLVVLSTSSFVVTQNKAFCTLLGVSKTTFQQRMRVAIKRAGSQSALARLVNERYGTTLKPQNIQYLASNKPAGGKPAQGSRNVSRIASVVGLRPEWLESGEGQQDAGPTPKAAATKPTEPIVRKRKRIATANAKSRPTQ